jgi:hypothetical protein
MAVYAGTGGTTKLTADQFRARSGQSCVPGADTPSGGLFISDVIRVADLFNVHLDYGQPIPYTRWTMVALTSRLAGAYGAVLLGDYDQVPNPYRQPGSTFMGDHSVYVHDYEDDDQTVCWHDPLRTAPIRVPLNVVQHYWLKPTSAVRGYAGFVRLPVAPVRYRIHLTPYADIRIYDMAKDPTLTTAGVIRGWRDINWGRLPSSAPCGPIMRAVYKTSDARVAKVTSGAFKGEWVRIGKLFGVTHTKVGA